MRNWLLFAGYSKLRLFVVAVLILTAAGAGFVFFGSKKRTAEYKSGQDIFPSVALKEFVDRDSDEDGLKDWEENIYGTDPKNPDTDGDGTEDGEEISLNRDPLKKPPDEHLPAALVESDPMNDKKNAPNLTKKLTSTFLELYLAQQLSGQKVNLPETYSNALATTESSKEIFRSFDPQGLIMADGGPEAVRAYLNRVAEIAEENLLSWTPDPLELFASVLQRENFENQLSRFDTYIEKTQRSVELLKNVPVPISWTQEHVGFINTLLTMETALLAMRHADEDIIFTLTTLKPYTAAQGSLRDALLRARAKAENEGVRFAQNETANRLFNLRILIK